MTQELCFLKKGMHIIECIYLQHIFMYCNRKVAIKEQKQHLKLGSKLLIEVP